MKTKLTGLVLAAIFTMGVVGVGWAANVNCKVEKVEGTKVTLDCGSRSDEFKVGTQVKVKKAKNVAIEGC
ncbi:MAG: hypothetical protein OEY01_01740 [Desulfobulbaceae bacterium]|nr:hypothetical protein [Desulfobulbaceae bacterium]HIJ78014.1 hypothetical protein [Deltaproteobacteria bacterium]